MPFSPNEIALRDMLQHIDLAERFVSGFDQATFNEDARTVLHELSRLE